MAMKYAHVAIPDHEIPVAVEPLMQHALQTYASETNKVVSVWSLFSDDDLAFCPHPRASTRGPGALSCCRSRSRAVCAHRAAVRRNDGGWLGRRGKNALAACGRIGACMEVQWVLRDA